MKKSYEFSDYIDGQKFLAIINNLPTFGEVCVLGTGVYLLQNYNNGSEVADKRGWEFSWAVCKGDGESLSKNSVRGLILSPSEQEAKDFLAIKDGCQIYYISQLKEALALKKGVFVSNYLGIVSIHKEGPYYTQRYSRSMKTISPARDCIYMHKLFWKENIPDSSSLSFEEAVDISSCKIGDVVYDINDLCQIVNSENVTHILKLCASFRRVLTEEEKNVVRKEYFGIGKDYFSSMIKRQILPFNGMLNAIRTYAKRPSDGFFAGYGCCDALKIVGSRPIELIIPEEHMNYAGYKRKDLGEWVDFLNKAFKLDIFSISDDLFEHTDFVTRAEISLIPSQIVKGNKFYHLSMFPHDFCQKLTYLRLAALRYIWRSEYWHIPRVAMDVHKRTHLSEWESLLLAHLIHPVDRGYSLVDTINHIVNPFQSLEEVGKQLQEGKGLNASFKYIPYDESLYNEIFHNMRQRKYKKTINIIKKHLNV